MIKNANKSIVTKKKKKVIRPKDGGRMDGKQHEVFKGRWKCSAFFFFKGNAL